MKCKKGYEVKVLRSAVGYYKGTLDESGFPNCRLTGYSPDEKAADSLKITREFYCIENEFCNGGTGCGFGESAGVLK